MNVFLSASVPDPRRHPRYHGTADVVAIREAVRGLATVIAKRPDARLMWGGHPAITPLVREVVRSMGASVRQRVQLFQSAYFEREFPPDNADFEQVIVTPRTGGRDESLAVMREVMLGAHRQFDAGVFIGGMEGVEDEWAIFINRHPRTRVLPVATTGAAARILFDENRHLLPAETARLLETEYAYMSLFRRTLPQAPGEPGGAAGSTGGPTGMVGPTGTVGGSGRTEARSGGTATGAGGTTGGSGSTGGGSGGTAGGPVAEAGGAAGD